MAAPPRLVVSHTRPSAGAVRSLALESGQIMSPLHDPTWPLTGSPSGTSIAGAWTAEEVTGPTKSWRPSRPELPRPRARLPANEQSWRDGERYGHIPEIRPRRARAPVVQSDADARPGRRRHRRPPAERRERRRQLAHVQPDVQRLALQPARSDQHRQHQEAGAEVDLRRGRSR